MIDKETKKTKKYLGSLHDLDGRAWHLIVNSYDGPGETIRHDDVISIHHLPNAVWVVFDGAEGVGNCLEVGAIQFYIKCAVRIGDHHGAGVVHIKGEFARVLADVCWAGGQHQAQDQGR